MCTSWVLSKNLIDRNIIVKSISIFTLNLPLKRPFQWRVYFALVALYFFGNLAGLPLLRKTDMPIEPVWFWGGATLISAIIIALSLTLANRTGLGAPLLEGKLPREDLPAWLRGGFGLTLLMLVVGFPFSLIANLNANPTTYPFGWELLPASFKAGVVEEIIYRFFWVSLFVWIGRLFKHDAEGHPYSSVYWVAILLTGLMFGWAHVDAMVGHPTAIFWDYALIMLLGSAQGIFFGWILWKLGLEWAMFVHFAYDAFFSIFVIPVYMLKSPFGWALLIAGLIIMLVISWRLLTQSQLIERSVV
jgi:hypothetical protein